MSIIKLQGNQEKLKGIHYEFDSEEEPLGIGGMGTVYRGRCISENNNSSRIVAVKFMREDIELSESVIERAKREASIHINNQNLVEMLGFIETEYKGVLGEVKKHYHVVSELLTGVMLDDLLHGKTTDHDGNQISFAQTLYKKFRNDPYHFAIYVIKNILSGVMALHDAGYIHRDIDPTNIMITTDGHVKLIDFGIAKKLTSLTAHDKSLTITGQFMGKARFASPELVLGDLKSQGKSTDIYALGILLFMLIVGHLPFEGPDNVVLDMQLHKKMPLKLIHQKKMREVIGRATNKNSGLRFQSAAEFRVAVEQLENVQYPENNILEIFKDYISRNVKSIGIAAATLLLCGGGYCFYEYIDKIPVPVKPIPPKSRPVPVKLITYDSAVSLLNSPTNAQKGLKELESLAEKSDFKSIYLLSRLYYVDKTGKYYESDDVKAMRRNCGIVVDLKKSHQLNLKAVSLNPKDYKALYELGADYVSGEKRTGGDIRDIRKADRYLNIALTYAKENKDKLYIELISSQIKRIRPYI